MKIDNSRSTSIIEPTNVKTSFKIQEVQKQLIQRKQLQRCEARTQSAAETALAKTYSATKPSHIQQHSSYSQIRVAHKQQHSLHCRILLAIQKRKNCYCYMCHKLIDKTIWCWLPTTEEKWWYKITNIFFK